MIKGKIGVGLIGLGEISTAHESGYKSIADRATIAAVCDINEEVAFNRAKTCGATGYTDYMRLLEDPKIHVVDIMLPHHLHYKMAKEALNHGKHVIVEKPMTLVSDEALDLIKTADKLDLKFTVLENTRFIEAYLEAEKLIREGILGEPRLIRTFIYGNGIHHILNPNDWKGHTKGAGILMDAGAHTMFLLQWLFGEIDEVQAFPYYLLDKSGIEDYGTIVGKLKNGTRFSTEYTRALNAIWSERLEYYGSEGALFIDQRFDPPAIYFKGTPDHAGTRLDKVPYQPDSWKERSIAKGVEDFIDAVKEHKTPTVNPMDGHYAVKALERAYQSIETGAPVEID